jgi:hypothetical protein
VSEIQESRQAGPVVYRGPDVTRTLVSALRDVKKAGAAAISDVLAFVVAQLAVISTLLGKFEQWSSASEV